MAIIITFPVFIFSLSCLGIAPGVVEVRYKSFIGKRLWFSPFSRLDIYPFTVGCIWGLESENILHGVYVLLLHIQSETINSNVASLIAL